VGKTSVSAAIALAAAREGQRVLVCETEPRGSIASAFERTSLSYEPTAVHPGIDALVVDTESSLREYLRLYTRVPVVARLGPIARTFDFVAQAAPGVREILTVGKLCYEARERRYDLIVADAQATGHIVGQLASPWAINELVQVGLVRDQTRWMTDILEDPAQTGVVVVTTPEEMPVAETIDLLERLQSAVPVRPAAVVVNRVLPEPFARREEDVFERLREPDARAVLRSVGGRAVSHVLDATELAVARRRMSVEHIETLRRALSNDIPMVLLPELFARAGGKRLITQLSEALGDEIS
jgi:anion-transporting  ArsA/GET3 family ATPase